jgi:hypothetical protein
MVRLRVSNYMRLLHRLLNPFNILAAAAVIMFISSVAAALMR